MNCHNFITGSKLTVMLKVKLRIKTSELTNIQLPSSFFKTVKLTQALMSSKITSPRFSRTYKCLKIHFAILCKSKACLSLSLKIWSRKIWKWKKLTRHFSIRSVSNPKNKAKLVFLQSLTSSHKIKKLNLFKIIHPRFTVFTMICTLLTWKTTSNSKTLIW